MPDVRQRYYAAMMNTSYNPAEQGIQAARRDALPWQYSDNDHFRKLPAVESLHNGCRVMVIECEEYVDGRWEGFVSVQPVKEACRG